jgi:subtilisin family serine protease
MSRRTAVALLSAAALLAGTAAATAASPSVSPSAPRGSVPVEASLLDGGLQHGFVELRRTPTTADVNALLALGAVKVHPFRLVPQVAFVAPSSAVRAIAGLPGAVRLQEDHGLRLELDQSKKAIGATRARAPKPQGLGLTGKGVNVAVLDTGVDITHPDFAALQHSYNTEFAWITEPVQDGMYGQQTFELTEAYGGVDDNGHGTHVASTS